MGTIYNSLGNKGRCEELVLEFFNERKKALASPNVQILIENHFESCKSALLQSFGVIVKELK